MLTDLNPESVLQFLSFIQTYDEAVRELETNKKRFHIEFDDIACRCSLSDEITENSFIFYHKIPALIEEISWRIAELKEESGELYLNEDKIFGKTAIEILVLAQKFEELREEFIERKESGLQERINKFCIW